MPSLREFRYRTFDQLMQEIAVDLSSYNAESVIEPAELIKVAQKCNYLLGLKINQVKETILDVDCGKAKLPADFEYLNVALLCNHYTVVNPLVSNGIQSRDIVTFNADTSGSCECVTADTACATINPDPWFQNKVYSLCDNTVNVKVVQECKYERREFTSFEKLYMHPSVEVTAFCMNKQFRNCGNHGSIRDGFIYTSAESCKIYINYLGAMEDAEGNLLVLDHPLINEYYEYALKERILTNLYINGEPDIERRLQFVQNELRRVKREALSIAYMPDYKELVQVIEGRKLEMYHRYVEPFQRQYNLWDYNWY